MTAVPTNAKVLKWAREIRCVSPDEAARRLSWELSYLEAVEAGREPIDHQRLERMARAYKLPVATLLMPEPLDPERYGPRPISDFRLHRGGSHELSPETRRFVENAWELIDLALELGEVAPLPSYSLADKEIEAAASERARIGITVQDQLNWNGERNAFLNWRMAIEEEDVIVNSLNIKEDDIRGFAIHDGGASYICVNKNEEKDRAKVYSLIHEYAHLLLRQSGLSDQNRSTPIERWCNQFAANFLLPKQAVLDFCRANGLINGRMGNWQVSRVSTAFKVSKSAVAIRFEELGLAEDGFYKALKATWPPRKISTGFDPDGDQIKVELNRYGVRHVAMILESLKAGKINKVEARYALDVNPQYHKEMLTAAFDRQIVHGRKRKN